MAGPRDNSGCAENNFDPFGKHLFPIPHFGSDGHHIFQPGNIARIPEGQRGGAAPTATHAATREVAGKNGYHIFPETGDLVLDLTGGAGGQTDRGDHRANTDDDSQHGEQRTHLIATQGAAGDF